MKRSLHAAAFLVFFLAGTVCSPVAAQTPPEVLSVLDFTDNGDNAEWAWLSAGLADMLITDLAETDLSVVDRDDMNAVLEEQSLALTGLTDEGAVEIGRLVSADALLTGSFAVVGEILRIDAKIVDVTTGAVIGTAVADGHSQTVFELEKRLADEICRTLGISLLPERKVGRESGAGTTSLPAARAYYEGLLLQSSGDIEAAKVRFEEAADLDPLFAKPRYSLEESWELLKDFRRLRRQREVNALWTKTDALIRRLAADPFISDSEMIMAAYNAESSTEQTGRPLTDDPSFGSCSSPAVCLWNLQITYWEIGSKSAEYFDDETTRQAALMEIIALACQAEEAWPDDEWLSEIIYWETLAYRWLENWQETAAGCERFFVEWPDHRMAWAVEDMYEMALEHLAK